MLTVATNRKRRLDAKTRFEDSNVYHLKYDCSWEEPSFIKKPSRFMSASIKREIGDEAYFRALRVEGNTVFVTVSTLEGAEAVKQLAAKLLATIKSPPHTKLFIKGINNLRTEHVKTALSVYGKVTFWKRLGGSKHDENEDYGEAASCGLRPHQGVTEIDELIEFEVVGSGTFTFSVSLAETKDARVARLAQA